MALRLPMLASVVAPLLASLSGDHERPRTRQPLDSWPSGTRSEAY